MALGDKDCLHSIRELLRSPGVISKLDSDGVALLDVEYDNVDSLLTSVLSSFSSSSSLHACVGRASRRNLILGIITSWGEASQRLLSFLLNNEYRPGSCDCRCLNDHDTPLTVACRVGNLPAISALMPVRLAFDTGENLGETAVAAGQLSVVQLLTETGEIDLKSDVGLKLLTAAVKHEHLAIARFLLRRGASLSGSLVTQNSAFVGQLLRTLTESDDDVDTVASLKSGKSNVALQWKSLSLAEIQGEWVTDKSLTITELDVSKNQLLSLPSAVFTHMKSLQTLNVSDNSLAGLGNDSAIMQSTSLKFLNLNSNQLTHVSKVLFTLPNLNTLKVSHNHLRNLPDAGGDPSNNWSLSVLKHLDVSRNKLDSLPPSFKQLRYLRTLNVSHNELKELPGNWSTSLLEVLNASHNQLTEFPLGAEVMLAQSLKDLNLSRNQLSEIAWSIPQLSRLTTLNLSHNKITELPLPNWWTCNQLEELNLSNNWLDNSELDEPVVSDLSESTSPRSEKRAQQRVSQSSDVGHDSGEKSWKAKVEFPVLLFKPFLKRLKLDNNRLVTVPESVCGLTALTQLSLSNNRRLCILPSKLGNLKNCWLMELQGLDLVNVPDYVRPEMGKGSTKHLLAYLRAQLRQSVPYARVKLMVVGLQSRGKTSLLKRLRGEPLPTVDISTVGVEVAEWQLPGSSGGGKGRKQGGKPTIVLSTWDLAGQEVYYTTHQCFLSSNTLYLAVFSLENEEAGVDGLKLWLLNIQARAPDSFVIIVATHKDKMKGPNVSKRINELLKMISNRYCIKGYPNIVAIRAVSNVTGEGLSELQNDIQLAVTKLQDQDTKMPLIERLIPASYLALQKSVSDEAQRRRLTNEHGVIEQSEFLKMAEQSEENDIHDEEELHLAAKFLHEAGILLHYNDQLRGLANLYFIDPSWLIDLLAEFVTVRERHSFIQNGFLARCNVPFILRGKRFPEQYVDQYLQLLERFEIALSIDSEQMLVPSMLPVNKPDIPGVCSPHDSQFDEMTFLGKDFNAPEANESTVSKDQTTVVQPKKQGAIQKFGSFFTKAAAAKLSPPIKRRSKELQSPLRSPLNQTPLNRLEEQNPSLSSFPAMQSNVTEQNSTSTSTSSKLSTTSAALLLGGGDDDNQDDSDDDNQDDSDEVFNQKSDRIDYGRSHYQPARVESTKKDARFRAETLELSEFFTSRYYKMAYVPSGFWSRLIVRLLVNLERAGFGRPFSIRNTTPRQKLSSLELCDDNDSEEWIETKKRVSRSSVVLWRTGVVVVHKRGHFIVEALQHVPRIRAQIAKHLGQAEVDPTQLDGINVAVQSRGVKDFSAMGYIVDQIDGLIEDWFPGLTETNLFGEPLVCHFIPCMISEATALSPIGDKISLDRNVHLFKLTDCAKAAAIGDTIRGPVDDVPLSDLVPDLMLADIPPAKHIDKSQFDCGPSPETQLGAGGAGEVYIGQYQGKSVAVKLFTGAQCSGLIPAHDSSHDSLESSSVMSQLRGEDMVTVLRDLRQEAVVLSHLKHPCVVGLVGVSLRPLCLVMELAPKKSLNAILDEKVLEKRKEASHSQQGSIILSNKIVGVVLGNKVTYRIVYQIVSALAYLHAQTIIYRDLKPDNVLVWSLSLDDTINVKLSDYGISRFASPSGLKGEELGTPGFMAPEAMRKKGNDSAFDEKVDIFSFGMVLFQLLCGVRPYSHYKEQEINRAVYSGERPDLKKYSAATCFPRLEQLMYACWRVVSYERPSASDIITEMKDPSFSCLQHQLPKPQDEALFKVDCVYAKPKLTIEPQSSGKGLKRSGQIPTINLPWILAHSDNRLLSVLNAKLGVFKIKQMELNQRKVTCMTYVDGCMWMGIEVNRSIEVVGQPLVGMPLCIWNLHVGAPVLALATTIDHGATESNQEIVVDRVIAALANGSLCLFSRSLRWKELYGKTKASLEEGKNSWHLEKTLDVSPNNPIHSMVVIRGQTELWCTAYNQLFVIDLSKFEVVHSADVFVSSKSFITWLVADEQSVYGIDKRAPFVLQWDIASRQLCWILDCSRISLAIQTNVCLAPHEDVYLQIMNRCIRVMGLSNVTKFRNSAQTISVHPHEAQASQEQYSKLSRSLDSTDLTQAISSESSPALGRGNSPKNLVLKVEAAMPRLPQRITSLLIVKDTLWVARGMGDIIILKRDITGSGVCPVVGLLKAEENPAQYGNSSDQKLALVDNEQVVASQFLEPRDLQGGDAQKQLIAVYSAWGSSEFEKLLSFQHRLYEAERQYRKDR